jgi:hypothetical protein
MYWSDAGFSHRKLAERTSFPELPVQIRSTIGMTPVEMHLKLFGDKLELMPESFGQNAGVTLGVGYFDPKGFGSSVNDLLNFRQRFLVHAVSP